MSDYSEDGKWWWDGESWIPTTQQQQSNFGASNHLSEEASSPRIIVSKSSKKKLTLNLVTQNGTKQIEFVGTSWGGVIIWLLITRNLS